MSDFTVSVPIQLDNVKAELAGKQTELCSLQTRVETWEKQEEDLQQHITVLREQVDAKEQQGAMLQADVSDTPSTGGGHAAG